MRILIALVVALALAAAAANVAWSQRLEILMWAMPILRAWQNPVAPHRDITWPDGPATAQTPADQRPPNIVVILADDLGFNDVSFYNGGAADGSLQTLAIDALARSGVAFDMGYAANAVCAPSRASVMTGRYSTRFGFEFTPSFKIGATIADWMNDIENRPLPAIIDQDNLDLMPDDTFALGMPPQEITIAELLQQAGYHTAHIGKWHLGNSAGKQAHQQGFDNSLNMVGTFYLPEDHPDVVNAKRLTSIDRMVWSSAQYAVNFNGSESFEPRGYLTDYFTEEAVKVIEKNRHRPFFLYLAHWGIHNPLQAKRQDYDALSHIEDHALRVYAAMIRSLDRSVGQVMQALQDNGIADNTLVIFTSDNGGADYIGLPDINHPYRGWKLTHFEGGTHVPFFASWPGRIPAGLRFPAPVMHIDLLPTIAAAAGAPLPQDRIIDGVDLLPFMSATGPATAADTPHETLFWREGYLQSVQHQGWKLITSDRPDKDWLFDLSQDPTEQHNMAARQPQRVAAMKALLAEHNRTQMPPAWPSYIEAPVLIDKHGLQPYEEGDEYSYWPN